MPALELNQLPDQVPGHVAIIMDGNGRWAQDRGLPRTAGHEAGAEALRRTLDACVELQIRYLTIFAFSSENWRRPSLEVSTLLELMRDNLAIEVPKLVEKGIRLKFIGERNGLPDDVRRMMYEAEHETSAGDVLTVTVALNYGARNEILRAARALIEECLKETATLDSIDEERFSRHLDTANLPDPDLIIRTSGEQRLSNFLVWQGAYSELVFIPILWPDFDRNALDFALDEFRRRDRRFGAIAVS